MCFSAVCTYSTDNLLSDELRHHQSSPSCLSWHPEDRNDPLRFHTHSFWSSRTTCVLFRWCFAFRIVWCIYIAERCVFQKQLLWGLSLRASTRWRQPICETKTFFSWFFVANKNTNFSLYSRSLVCSAGQLLFICVTLIVSGAFYSKC